MPNLHPIPCPSECVFDWRPYFQDDQGNLYVFEEDAPRPCTADELEFLKATSTQNTIPPWERTGIILADAGLAQLKPRTTFPKLW